MKHSIKSNLSKRLFAAVIAFVIITGASAQQFFEDPNSKIKKIDLAESFDRIEVRGNATIVLTNELTHSVALRGDAADLDQATVRIKKGKLVINASKTQYASKFIVYLPAATINSLATSGITQILSSGTVKVQDLEILLYGTSQVSIKHQGKLTITPGTGYELTEGRRL